MKELTRKILRQALKDGEAPYQGMLKSRSTHSGLCVYFKKEHDINFFRTDNPPWAKYATRPIHLEGLHFEGFGFEIQGRRERVIAIKGMIQDLKEKQNGKQ